MKEKHWQAGVNILRLHKMRLDEREFVKNVY